MNKVSGPELGRALANVNVDGCDPGDVVLVAGAVRWPVPAARMVTDRFKLCSVGSTSTQLFLRTSFEEIDRAVVAMERARGLFVPLQFAVSSRVQDCVAEIAASSRPGSVSITIHPDRDGMAVRPADVAGLAASLTAVGAELCHVSCASSLTYASVRLGDEPAAALSVLGGSPMIRSVAARSQGSPGRPWR